ncbi:mechanosensitive ion channel family protein [bacterium]|nr:mechanosensitive ion channel family protein [bacterium]
MESLSELLKQSAGMKSHMGHLVYTVFIILALWLIRKILVRIIMGQSDDAHTRYIWQKGLTYGVTFLGLFLIARIWFSGLAKLDTFLGLLSAGLAIAMKDVITNVIGWFFIMWVRPLEVGDRVQIGAYSGDVVDKSIFHITLMEIGNWVDADQSTGRIISIPNSFLFTMPLANFSKGFHFIWNEIPVLVTFESNWEKAKEILLSIALRHSAHLSSEAEKKVKEASKRFFIHYSKLTPIVYTNVKDCGILLTIRYLCEPRMRRGTQEGIWEDILAAFAKCDDIDFAYPTTRFYDNIREGKPGKEPSAQTGASPDSA